MSRRPIQQAPQPLTLIQGGLSVRPEMTEAEIRSYLCPNIKALPFVKLQADNQPAWSPASYWDVKPSGKWGRDSVLGRDYAIAAVAAMIADGRNVLGLIFSDMVRTAAERGAVRGKRPRLDAVMAGFIFQIARSMPEVARSRGV